MPKLSVVIITLNEERNIARCLESVQEVADEIVVVDSFSTDRTEEICNSFNIRFIKHAFEGHIEQKNWAISQVSYPHILSLDADEVLSGRLTRGNDSPRRATVRIATNRPSSRGTSNINHLTRTSACLVTSRTAWSAC